MLHQEEEDSWCSIIKQGEEKFKQIKEQVPLFSLRGVKTAARIFQVYDGDSFYMTLEVWPEMFLTFRARLAEVDTPELRGKHRVLGYKARDRVRSLVQDNICCVTCREFDKYGRVLVQVTLPDGQDLAQQLVDEKLACPYSGRGSKFSITSETL